MDTHSAAVTLKPGHIQPIWAGHPWVYAQAVQKVSGGARPGDAVVVVDPRGNFLGRGLYSPSSAIVVRMLTTSESEAIDGALFRRRLERAISHRHRFGLPSAETNGMRLVHAEGDGLPGLVVDLFGDVLVVQFGTVGMKLREQMLLDQLEALLAPRAILDRTASKAARDEKFEATSGVVRGDSGLSQLSFMERGLRYEIPLSLGQKTGFYFDQRPLRGRVEQLAKGKRVLDAYSYVGAFALAAARGGASEVLAVDESALALEIGAELAVRNELGAKIQHVPGDAREKLTEAGARGGYDLVICDPPKYAPSRGAKAGALLAYQKLAASACRATAPGGLLVFCSCSAAVGLDTLVRALSLGGREANVHVTVLERFFQGFDHPVPASFAEGLYLKSVIAQIDPRG